MATPAGLEKLTGLGSRFGGFVAERFPFALTHALEAVASATDNRLKAFCVGGEGRYGATAFQGKGFRSMGQEAIYGAAMRLRRGPKWRAADGSWTGDVIGPMIRDLGAAFAMRPEPATVRMVLNSPI